jgi:hypothetical protein
MLVSTCLPVDCCLSELALRYQHAYLDYCSASSLRPQTTGRHVDTNMLTCIIVVLAH